MGTKSKTIDIKSESLPYSIGSVKFYNTDWTTEAILLPRDTLLNKIVDSRLQSNTLYMLVGTDNITEKIYVGKATKRNSGESVLKRLSEHKESKTESYRDKWSYAIVLTSSNDSWTEGDVSALERIFYNLIPAENRLNANEPSGDLSIACREKVEHIKAYLEVIGVNTFTSIEEREEQITVQQIVENTLYVEDLQLGLARIPEIVTPLRIVKKMVDLIPEEKFNPDSKFLDLACKGGEYLREIYDRLMESESLKAKFPSVIERSNHILTNQLFGIALSKVSYERTKNKLMGFGYNIKIINNYINIIRNRATALLKQEINKEFGIDMSIDVIIGNPPYQESTGGGNNGGKVIYDGFIIAALSLSDNVCMVTKNNWMNSDALDSLRESIIKSGLKTLINYSLLGDIFPSMGIPACILYIDKNHSGEVDYTEIQKSKILNKYCANIKDLGYIPSSIDEYNIVKKIKESTEEYFDKYVVGTNPFGISTDGKLLGSNSFIDEQEDKDSNYNILLKYVKGFSYTYINAFRKNTELVNKYKIICTKQIHKTNNPIPKVFGLSPNEICSGSFSLMYCSNKAEDAYNVYKYISTKFFRFLTWCLADSLCGLKGYRVSLVPDQNFNSDSDIDWSQSITNIDQQLYRKYNLTPDEITYIESTIKSME